MPEAVGRSGEEKLRFLLKNETRSLCIGIWMDNRILAAARNASLDRDCIKRADNANHVTFPVSDCYQLQGDR